MVVQAKRMICFHCFDLSGVIAECTKPATFSRLESTIKLAVITVCGFEFFAALK